MLKDYGHYHYEKLAPSRQRVYMQIYDAMRKHDRVVRIQTSGMNIDFAEMFQILNYVYYDTPSFYYIDRTPWRLGRLGTTYEYRPSYLYSVEAIRDIDRRLTEGFQRFRKKFIRAGMSDLDKERLAHDYLVRTVSYDDRVNDPRDTRQEWRDYSGDDNLLGALARHEAVCGGISCAFKALCDSIELPSLVVVGVGNSIPRGQKPKEHDHAWNMVVLDGAMYHVDVTWDLDGGYRYFNLPDAKMELTHGWDHTLYPACTHPQRT